MLDNIKVWWYYSVLKKVLLDSKGQPYDRKGLQIVNGEFILSDEWEYHYYIKGGLYLSDGGEFIADRNNPFYLEDLNKTLEKFKGFNL